MHAHINRNGTNRIVAVGKISVVIFPPNVAHLSSRGISAHYIYSMVAPLLFPTHFSVACLCLCMSTEKYIDCAPRSFMYNELYIIVSEKRLLYN